MSKDEISVEIFELEEISYDDTESVIVIHTLELKKRSVFERILRFPFLFLHDYRILRRQNDVFGSLMGAYYLSRLIFEDGRSR